MPADAESSGRPGSRRPDFGDGNATDLDAGTGRGSVADRGACAGAIAGFSVIVPVLNEAAVVGECVRAVSGSGVQVIVADGGSSDETRAIAAAAGAQVVVGPAGRAFQMNQGAREARMGTLIFLHADTRLPPGWQAAIGEALALGAHWGRFDVRFDDAHPLLRLVATLMNARSRLSGIATGDQAIFVARDCWQRSGGYATIPLMEDIEFSRRLRRTAGAPACLRSRVTTSARRWRRNGILRTILLMWWLRLRYFLGASPQALHAVYYRPRK